MKSITKTRYRSVILIAAIVIATAIAFLPCLRNAFVEWDDYDYVVKNDVIRNISLANLKAMFTRPFVATYCPLVMISYSIEYQIARLDPVLYHATNYALHIASTILVFIFLRSLSGSAAVGLVASLLFGVHPVHVESVAWVSERKDMLSSFFYLVALTAYVRYARDRRRRSYIACALALVLSLLSKGMAVTAPFIFVLIDHFLGRPVDRKTIIEKIPLLIIAAAFGYITYHFQAVTGATGLIADTRFRFYFITKAIPFYLSKIFCPAGLSAIYPYHNVGAEHLMEIKRHVAALLLIFAVIIASAKYARSLFFGGLFFLITIIPVLKIIPIGDAFAADRYLYIPSIGLAFFFADAVVRSARRGRRAARAIFVSIAILALTLAFMTWNRCVVWRDTESLFSDVLAKYPFVPVANLNIGSVLAERGEYDRAMRFFEKAALQRGSPVFRKMAVENIELARRQMLTTPPRASNPAAAQVRLAYDRAVARDFNRMGFEHERFECFEEAELLFKKSIELDPSYVEAYNNLSYLYYRRGDMQQAAEWFAKAADVQAGKVPGLEK